MELWSVPSKGQSLSSQYGLLFGPQRPGLNLVYILNIWTGCRGLIIRSNIYVKQNAVFEKMITDQEQGIVDKKSAGKGITQQIGFQ